MTCNVNSAAQVESNLIYNKYEIKLDNDTATDVAAISGAVGGSTGAIATALGSVGVLGPIGGVAASTLILICAVESSWLLASADGCGVKIDIWLLNDAVAPDTVEDIPYHYISPQ